MKLIDGNTPVNGRKHLNADALFVAVKNELGRIPDHRESSTIPLDDALMSAFAMFALKDPSLLAFDRRRLATPENLRSIFGISEIPCDSQMREICDQVELDLLRKPFRAVFREFQRGKGLEPFVFLNSYYLVSLDGTGIYSSDKIGSPSCMTKVNKKTGKISYYQQMLGSVIVHPDVREVIPLCPEMIINGDGQSKNDCERNAARRWLHEFRREHPHLPAIIIEDGLSPNAPHIKDLRKHNCRFILGVKPGDHKFLFEYVKEAREAGLTTEYEFADPENLDIIHRFSFIDKVSLNKSNPDVLVAFVEYWAVGPDQTKHFSWVTDLAVSTDNVYDIMRGGRARWGIENETFNTLKNQGYNLGHNYSLGAKNLSGVFATLMMLAFLVDQVQQHCSNVFQTAWAKTGAKIALWDDMRAFFKCFLFDSMTSLLMTIAKGVKLKPAELLDTS